MSAPTNGKEDSATNILELVANIAGRELTGEDSKALSRSLEQHVAERTRELVKANEDLHAEADKRMETESALRASEARYRTLFENSPAPMWELTSHHLRYIDDLKEIGVTDFRTHFESHPEDVTKLATAIEMVDMNKAAFELWGVDSLEEWMNARDVIYSGEFFCEIKEQLIALAHGETRIEHEYAFFFPKKGKRIHGIMSINFLPKIKRMVCSAIDVTELKEAEEEEEVRYLSEYLETILASLDVCVRVMEPKKDVEYENLLLKNSFGEGIGKPCYLLWGKNEPCENCSCEEAIKTNKVHRREEALPDGRTYAIASVPLKTRDDRPVAVEMVYDITSLKRSEHEIRSLTSRIISTQEDERKRISRDLHDEAGQYLTAVQVNLKLIGDRFQHDIEGTNKLISETLGMLDQTMEDLRKLSQDLRPAALDDMGLVAAMESYSDKYEERTGINVFVERGLDTQRFSQEVEISLFRILQELLTNAAKYSGAKNVIVKLFEDEGELVMNVRDDGCGFDIDEFWKENTQVRSLGLIGIRERAALLGGESGINSEPGKGTEIFVRLPQSL